MYTTQDQPLTAAKQVLQQATITEILKNRYLHNQGWTIIDRWCIQIPVRMKLLESHGVEGLMIEVMQQQEIELNALTLTSALELRKNGTPDMEILEMYGINTNLQYRNR